jgi:hypothetical protein
MVMVFEAVKGMPFALTPAAVTEVQLPGLPPREPGSGGVVLLLLQDTKPAIKIVKDRNLK